MRHQRERRPAPRARQKPGVVRACGDSDFLAIFMSTPKAPAKRPRLDGGSSKFEREVRVYDDVTGVPIDGKQFKGDPWSAFAMADVKICGIGHAVVLPNRGHPSVGGKALSHIIFEGVANAVATSGVGDGEHASLLDTVGRMWVTEVNQNRGKARASLVCWYNDFATMLSTREVPCPAGK